MMASSRSHACAIFFDIHHCLNLFDESFDADSPAVYQPILWIIREIRQYPQPLATPAPVINSLALSLDVLS